MTVKILTNSTSFLNQLKTDLRKTLKPRLRAAAGGLRNELTEKIPSWILKSTDIYLINNPNNRYELGITTEQLVSTMAAVANVVISAIRIEITNHPGGLRLFFDQEVLSSIKSISEGEYTSYNKKGEEKLVQWLNWLMTAGSRIVVEDYHFYGASGKGRTGGGLMYKGGWWRVPLEIRGDEQENFLTRIMDKKVKEMYRLMRGHLLQEKARLKYQ
jgi:hypothetical protein